MVSPQKIGIIFPEVSKEPLLDLPPMIQKNLEMTYIKDREVLYSDVDINQHMNNTRYIQWALDLIDFDWEYSVGDQKVSQRDFNRLLKNAGKIVEFKGKMVYLTKEDAERLKKQKDAHSNASLNKTVLLASALTGTFDNEQVLFEPNVKKAFAELLKKDEIEVPKQINAQLRAYQVRGFNWLMHNLNMGMGSIIADDMGLGKTIQVISAIAKLKDQGELQDKCVLVVLPATLLYNWEHELKRFAPQLDFKIVYGQKPETLESKDHDLFLTTYNYLVHNEELFTNLQLRLLVVDEAQNIKNSKTQASTVLRKLKRDCTIAMTGAVVMIMLYTWGNRHDEREARTSEIFALVDWTTIFFFAGLFAIVYGLEESGVLVLLGQKFVEFSRRVSHVEQNHSGCWNRKES